MKKEDKFSLLNLSSAIVGNNDFFIANFGSCGFIDIHIWCTGLVGGHVTVQFLEKNTFDAPVWFQTPELRHTFSSNGSIKFIRAGFPGGNVGLRISCNGVVGGEIGASALSSDLPYSGGHDKALSTDILKVYPSHFFLEVFGVNNLDDTTSADILYIGRENKDGRWVIEKQDSSGATTIITYATKSLNTGISAYQLAWTGRVGLNYNQYSIAF